MAIFASLVRRRSASGDQLPGSDLPDATRRMLPMRFEAVAEALMSDTDVVAACAVVGRDVARDGAALGEALDGLRATYTAVLGSAPEFDAAQALCVAWSEATLEYLHQLSCEDPLTGLASLAHVRTRLSELYRESERNGVSVRTSHALVIVETRLPAVTIPEHQFTRALRLVRVAESVRSVFSGGETIGRLGLDRVVAVVPRDRELGVSVALLRDLLGQIGLGSAGLRVWIEGLPESGSSATRLLDELAR